jgi:hypothetical protein
MWLKIQLHEHGGSRPPAGGRLLGIPVGEDLVLVLGLDHEALLDVEVREAIEDVQPLRREPVDLLQDRDGLGGETILCEVVGDALIELDRAVDPADSQVQIADLVDGVDVSRVGLQDLLVLLDRHLHLALLSKLFGVPEHFVPSRGHLSRCRDGDFR